MSISLTKVSRKLRKKFGLGRVRLFGSEVTAGDVVGRWKEERDKNLTRWKESYDKGVKEADTGLMKENLAEWYRQLTMISGKLREAVTPIYAEARMEYKQRKKKPAKVTVPV